MQNQFDIAFSISMFLDKGMKRDRWDGALSCLSCLQEHQLSDSFHFYVELFGGEMRWALWNAQKRIAYQIWNLNQVWTSHANRRRLSSRLRHLCWHTSPNRFRICENIFHSAGLWFLFTFHLPVIFLHKRYLRPSSPSRKFRLKFL